MIKKRHIRNYWKSSICLALLLCCVTTWAVVVQKEKKEPYYQMERAYSFPRSEKNMIAGDTTLVPFFDLLRGLKKNAEYTVSITHIGDSHIQADFETAVIRRLFQTYFGNAGRGLIAPLKLAGTNEPRNYRITSPQSWNVIRCIKPGHIPFGLTGLVLQINDSIGNISIMNMEDTSATGTVFDDLIVYYDTETSSVSILDTSLIECRKSNARYQERFVLKQPQSYIDLKFSSPDKKEISFYGVQLRNGKPGILYNAIGINGAHYSDYAGEKLFAEQTGSLHSDLFIISMGTNEAYDKRFSSADFYTKIDELVQQLKASSPQAVILLTTPVESWRRISRKSRVPHPNVEIARNTIVMYANDHGLPYWDLFKITGGKNSARSWTKNALFARDGIHFTASGYAYQGELLFQAIYNSYVNYINQ